MATLLTGKSNNQIKSLVSRAVFEVFNDPDFGLDLTSKAKKRLSFSSRNNNTISLSQLKQKYL